MLDLVDFHPLFTQLQTRYPTSSLLSELVQIHENRFVVRAVVEVGGVPLVSSLAAADKIEIAEDQARLRVLKLLGIQPIASSQTTSLQTTSSQTTSRRTTEGMAGVGATLSAVASGSATLSTLPNPLPNPRLDSASEPNSLSAEFEPHKSVEPSLSSLRSSVPLSAGEPFHEPPPVRTTALNLESVAPPPLSDINSSVPPLPDLLDLEPTPAPPPRKSRSAAASSVPSSAASTAASKVVPIVPTTPTIPNDFSDPIAQTKVEMERIGWTNEQGRKHLMRTYGKRSRQQLTDEELLDFLKFLQSCPSTAELPLG